MGIQQHHWSSQLADELQKPRRKLFQECTVFAKQVDTIWTADLVDMSPFSRSNSGYRFLLIVIDVFNQVWVDRAFKNQNCLPLARLRLWTDKGIEFYSKELKAVLTANSGTLYSTENEEKSSVVERWNRTIKNIM